MPDYYERAHMETAPKGVPMKIAEARQKKRLEDKKAKAEKVLWLNPSSNKAAIRKEAADGRPKKRQKQVQNQSREPCEEPKPEQ